MPERPALGEETGKRENAAFLILFFGAVLLLPVIVNLFLVRSRIAGLPTEMVYLLAIWCLMIVAAIFLSRWLPQEKEIVSARDEGREGEAKSDAGA